MTGFHVLVPDEADPEVADRRPGAVDDLPDDRGDDQHREERRERRQGVERAVADAVGEVAGAAQDWRSAAAAASTRGSFPARRPRREGSSPLRHSSFTSCAPRRRTTSADTLYVNVVEPASTSARHWPARRRRKPPPRRRGATRSSTSTICPSRTGRRSRSRASRSTSTRTRSRR